MAKILIVDDEPDIYQLIRRYALHEGYETMEASNGKEAVDMCRAYDFDIVIMDVMMPDMDGLTASREIRKMKDIPILMLSARGEEEDKLSGFDTGIDDYVVKPFSPRELMARVRVIISRRQANGGREAQSERVLRFGKLSIDVPGRQVYVDEIKTELTAKEFDLLLYFAEHKRIVLTREKLLEAVWGYACPGEDRTVDWQVKLLRNKLGGCRNYIVTVRGVGYRFDGEP